MAALRAFAIILILLFFFGLIIPAAAVFRGSGMRASTNLSRSLCRVLLALLGIEVCIIKDTDPEESRLVVANHVSWIDVLALGSVEPLCFVAKSEIASWPLISAFVASQGTVFVDRRRRRCIPRVNRDMAGRLRDSRSVLLFPEGTTHDGRELGRFHTSHLACLRDLWVTDPNRRGLVQPVAIQYSDPLAAWIGDASLVPHVWAVLRAGPIRCSMHYGPLHRTAPGFDRKVLGPTLRNAIADLIAQDDPDVARRPDEDFPSKPVAVGAAV